MGTLNFAFVTVIVFQLRICHRCLFPLDYTARCAAAARGHPLCPALLAPQVAFYRLARCVVLDAVQRVSPDSWVVFVRSTVVSA